MTAPQYTELDRMGNSSSGRGGVAIRYALLHTEEGDSSAQSLATYCNNPAHNASYHYIIRDRIVCDVVDTDLSSWSVGDANPYTLNYCFAGSRASWSREQWLVRDDDLRIVAWLIVADARKYGFSTQWLGSGGRYSPARSGVSDHQYVTDIIGWGSHTDCGPGFPGDVFARYLAEYAGTAPGGDDMQLSDTITDAYGNKVSVADVLKYISYHGDLAADQLGGPGTRQGIPAKFGGWPQLGGKTVVDSLADAHAKLDKLTAAVNALTKGMGA